MDENELAIVGIIGAGVVFVFLVWLRGRKRAANRDATLARMRAGLGPRDALVVLPPQGALRTCWHCGQAGDTVRPLSLSRLIALGAAAREEITLAVPLCASHGTPNQLGNLFRLVAFPIAAVLFTAVVVGLHARHSRLVEPEQNATTLVATLGASVVVWFVLRTLANTRTSVRLLWSDPAVDAAAVRFDDAARAEKVRAELDAPA